MRVLGLAYHVGSGNFVAASGKALMDKGDDVTFVAQDDRQAGVAFKNYGIDYKTLSGFEGKDDVSKLDFVLSKVKPEVIITGSSPQVRQDEFVIEQRVISKVLGIPVVGGIDIHAGYAERFSNLGTFDFRYLPRTS